MQVPKSYYIFGNEYSVNTELLNTSKDCFIKQVNDKGIVCDLLCIKTIFLPTGRKGGFLSCFADKKKLFYKMYITPNVYMFILIGYVYLSVWGLVIILHVI